MGGTPPTAIATTMVFFTSKATPPVTTVFTIVVYVDRDFELVWLLSKGEEADNGTTPYLSQKPITVDGIVIKTSTTNPKFALAHSADQIRLYYVAADNKLKELCLSADADGSFLKSKWFRGTGDTRQPTFDKEVSTELSPTSPLSAKMDQQRIKVFFIPKATPDKLTVAWNNPQTKSGQPVWTQRVAFEQWGI